MDKLITYTNSKGESIAIGKDGIRYSETDIHDYSYEYATDNNEFSYIRPSVKEITITICIRRGGLDARNRLHEVIDYDSAECKDGTLDVCGWNLKCRAVESTKDNWWFDDGVLKNKIKFVAADPMWRREDTHSFLPNSASGIVNTGVDFPLDFPFDFGGVSRSSILANKASKPCAFRLVVYGPCNNPYVVVGDNLYQVNVSVQGRGRLVIDSTKRHAIGESIVLYDKYGNSSSVFPKRLAAVSGSGKYVFEKISVGNLVVSWPQTFGFDITLIEEESEPLWN